MRADLLEADEAVAVWHAASELFRRNEHQPGGERTLLLALRHGISASDAQFVAVAEDLDARLVTADAALAAAVPDRAVALAAMTLCFVAIARVRRIRRILCRSVLGVGSRR